MSEKKKPRANKGNNNLTHQNMEEVLNASLSNPERSSEYVRSEIIKAIKDQDGYEYSKNGHNITIETLCLLLPELSREEIVSAMVDMRGISVLSPATGSINITAIYFWIGDAH